MNKQEKEILQAMHTSMEQLYAGLEGKAVSAETLAAALARLCPDVSARELEQDCRSLLEGIHSGTEFARDLLDMPEEMLAKVFPDQVRAALEQMDPEQQHQYLIMLYQYLSQSVGIAISRDEAIAVANASTEDLFRRISDLGQYAQAEITNETAEVFHESLRQVASSPLPEGADRYTQEERMWVLSAALYAQARETNPEKVPAALIGEVVGMSASAADAFRDRLIGRIIPQAVGVLSVAAAGALVFFGVKALMGWSLFASAMSWLTSRLSPAVVCFICASQLLEPAAMLAESIYEIAYTATAAFTARFLRDEARDAYFRNAYVMVPGEGMTDVIGNVRDISEQPTVTENIFGEYVGKDFVWEDDIEDEETEEEDDY